MCVILQIEKGVKVPTAKLERACDINPNGYGIAYIDKGSIQVIRSVANNDPKEVADHLARLNDRQVFVHLRYATVGGVTLTNNHPFVVLENRKRIQLVMMHNGTLSSYSPKEDKETSDTKIFVDRLARPIALRTAAYSGPERVLQDHIFQRLVDLEAGVSVLVFFDKWGNVLKINEQRGKQFDGWWASNDYSFDDRHSRSSARTTSTVSWVNRYQSRGPSYGHNQRRGLPWEEDRVDDPISNRMAEAWKKDTAPKHLLPFDPNVPVGAAWIEKSVPYHATGFIKLHTEIKAVKTMVEAAKETENSIRNLTVHRKSFIEMAGMSSLDDLGNLTQADMEELCKNYPAAMAQMFTDLYGEMRDHKRARDNQARTIIELTKDKK